MAILLVRHGRTDGNARRILQHPETPLSAEGEDQARRLAARLVSERIGEVLCSDYARARTTAEAVARACGAPLEVDPGLRERFFGELNGRAYADLGFDPFAPDYTPPGGESWRDLHARVDAVWPRVCARADTVDGDLVVVTHGLFCHSLAARHLDLEAHPTDFGGFGNTSLTVIDPEPPFAVRLLACVAHLDEVLDSAPA